MKSVHNYSVCLSRTREASKGATQSIYVKDDVIYILTSIINDARRRAVTNSKWVGTKPEERMRMLASVGLQCLCVAEVSKKEPRQASYVLSEQFVHRGAFATPRNIL